MSGSLRVARAALSNGAIRSTLVAFLFESVGEWVRWVALLVYGFDHSGAADAGLISVIQLVPAAILTPLTSSLADRFPRTRVLLVGYLAGAIGTGGAGVAVRRRSPRRSTPSVASASSPATAARC